MMKVEWMACISQWTNYDGRWVVLETKKNFFFLTATLVLVDLRKYPKSKQSQPSSDSDNEFALNVLDKLNTNRNYINGVNDFVWGFWEEFETWSAFIDFWEKKKPNSYPLFSQSPEHLCVFKSSLAASVVLFLVVDVTTLKLWGNGACNPYFGEQ